ncbi:MAG: CpXC domain-containing protein [Caldimonas sp.]
MSIFRTVELPCPACQTPVEFELAHSVSADRRPDLRDAILEGTFQRGTCPACKTMFRVDPEFTYMDIGRGQYIGVWPVSRRVEWRSCADKTQEVFEQTLGSGASAEARSLGRKLTPRVVFGWPALGEKILARQAGIDDRTLEVAKMAVLRTRDDVPLPGGQEFRLVGELDGDPVLAWVRTDDERRQDGIRMPRALIGDIEAEPEQWKPAFDEVAEGLVVDFQREMLAAA